MDYLGIPIWLLIIVLAWTFTLKGFALWKSARRKSLPWFIVLLVVNTLGILEILYLFLFSELNLEKRKRKISKN